MSESYGTGARGRNLHHRSREVLRDDFHGDPLRDLDAALSEVEFLRGLLRELLPGIPSDAHGQDAPCTCGHGDERHPRDHFASADAKCPRWLAHHAFVDARMEVSRG